MHLMAFVIVPATCYLPQGFGQMLVMLPLFGFFAGGIHAGYAIYFPELFPSHLRATGGEVGASSALAPKIGPLGLSPKK